MKATLKLNDGREIAVDISEETLKEIEKPVKKTGYEINTVNDLWYFVDDESHVLDTSESLITTDFRDNHYNNANFYTDKTVAENNARADALKRKLRRFAVEHRNKKLDWNNFFEKKWEIYYFHPDKIIRIAVNTNSRGFGSISFDTKEAAEAAVEEFKDELIWYFTEYKDSL